MLMIIPVINALKLAKHVVYQMIILVVSFVVKDTNSTPIACVKKLKKKFKKMMIMKMMTIMKTMMLLMMIE